MHKAFYGKYNGIFRACVNSVYQASPRGEGPGDEVNSNGDDKFYCCKGGAT